VGIAEIWRFLNFKITTIRHLGFLNTQNFKADVTPAILSRDFVAQLYRATKSLQLCRINQN